MIYVSLAFKDYPNDKLVSFLNTVHQQMSTNPQYAFLKQYVDELKVRNAAFVVSIALASRRDGKRIEERDALKVDLLDFTVKKIARPLEDSDQNSASFITDAGFEVRGVKSKGKKAENPPLTELAMPTNVVGVNLSKTGSATLTWIESLNATNYALYFREKTETAWQIGGYNDKPTFTFTNLKSNTLYEFYICALGPNGVASEPTAPIPIYVT